MSLEFSHKPDYFLCAQLVIHHIQNHLAKHPSANNATFDLREIYDLFRHDLASATTNLEGIMNIADAYAIETMQGDQTLIQHYSIDGQNNTLFIDFNLGAIESLKQGKTLVPPDATLQQ